MKKIMLLLLILVTFLASSINAAEISIATSVYTKHFNESGLNESNDVLAIKYDHLFASTFENSHYNRSWFLGYCFSTKKHSKKDFFLKGNLYLGPLYGYHGDVPNIEGWTLGIAPTIEVGFKKISLETMVVPLDGGVLCTMIKYTF